MSLRRLPSPALPQKLAEVVPCRRWCRAGGDAVPQHPGTGLSCSDDRSPEVFKTRIEAATQMKSVLGANEKPNCLIIDEIDGAPAVSPAWIRPPFALTA